MTAARIVRDSTAADRAGILDLTASAFPDEELRPLVKALLDAGDGVLSLVGVEADRLRGNVLFTLCGPDGQTSAGALLGPLAVAPDGQRQGWGSALVRAGLARLADRGIRQIFVLGDPGYYGRFGFVAETDCLPPYPLPEEWAGAWQSVTLADRGPLPSGPLRLPAPWMPPALWLP